MLLKYNIKTFYIFYTMLTDCLLLFTADHYSHIFFGPCDFKIYFSLNYFAHSFLPYSCYDFPVDKSILKPGIWYYF